MGGCILLSERRYKGCALVTGVQTWPLPISGTGADIDVIGSRGETDATYRRLPVADSPDASRAIFSSQRFGLWGEPALPVEFMTGLEVLLDGGWHSVQPHTRQSIDCGGHEVFVPERGELVTILQSFGRPKDLLRAEALGRV